MALRWRCMIDSAQHFGEFEDMEAMMDFSAVKASGGESQDGEASYNGTNVDPGESHPSKRSRLLPFGSDLIPTPIGCAAFVYQKNMDEIDGEYTKVFFRGKSVLGLKENIGVPELVRDAEDKHQNRIVLKARLRQLKNEVDRQRRIRQLNQRTYAAAQERAVRIESLVSEMRTDLRSLKRRLDEEVKALGIDDAEAEKIMLAYYNRDGSGDGDESSPLKRSRNNP
ncbi:hypothetical protein ACA910_021767 [Epithemia clementina (nom. ined.)]